MNPFVESVASAAQLVAGGDPQLFHIVGLSLGVSALACVIATAMGLF
ncbi:MAG: ABC transporter permease, partial [Betaproteobacteria bacterium]